MRFHRLTAHVGTPWLLFLLLVDSIPGREPPPRLCATRLRVDVLGSKRGPDPGLYRDRGDAEAQLALFSAISRPTWRLEDEAFLN